MVRSLHAAAILLSALATGVEAQPPPGSDGSRNHAAGGKTIPRVAILSVEPDSIPLKSGQTELTIRLAFLDAPNGVDDEEQTLEDHLGETLGESNVTFVSTRISGWSKTRMPHAKSSPDMSITVMFRPEEFLPAPGDPRYSIVTKQEGEVPDAVIIQVAGALGAAVLRLNPTCPAGTYYEDDAASQRCEPCPARTFSNGSSSCSSGCVVHCEPCPTGSDAPPGSDDCTVCQPGWYWSHSLVECVVCPDNARCFGGDKQPVPVPGFYVHYDNMLVDSHHIIPCSVFSRQSLCVGGAALRETAELLPQWAPRYTSEDRGCWSAYNFTATQVDRADIGDTSQAAHATNESANDGNIACDAAHLMCSEGATGLLCGACEETYTFDAIAGQCEKCSPDRTHTFVTVLISAAAAMLMFLLYHSNQSLQHLGERGFAGSVHQWPIIHLVRRIDIGMLKVIWTGISIVATVAKTVEVSFPDPFRSLLYGFRFTQAEAFDGLGIGCIYPKWHNYHAQALVTSIVPLLVVAGIWLVWAVRALVVAFDDHDTSVQRAHVFSQHMGAFLVFTYVVLPSVMSVQFKSLRCMDLTSYGINERFLRVDSSIDCDSAAHDDFRKWIIPLIVIYQLIPVMYYALLLQIKDRIKDTPGKHVGMVTAKSDLELMPLRFLYRGYGTNFWFFELVDTYRRILFIGVAPLFETSAHRALAGTTLSFMSVVVYRELQPYKNPSTNMLSMATNYQVAFTYSCALLLDGGLLDEYQKESSMPLGMILLLVNLLVLLLFILLGLKNLSDYSVTTRRLQEALEIARERSTRRNSGVRKTRFDKSEEALPRVLRNFVPICDVEHVMSATSILRELESEFLDLHDKHYRDIERFKEGKPTFKHVGSSRERLKLTMRKISTVNLGFTSLRHIATRSSSSSVVVPGSPYGSPQESFDADIQRNLSPTPGVRRLQSNGVQRLDSHAEHHEEDHSNEENSDEEPEDDQSVHRGPQHQSPSGTGRAVDENFFAKTPANVQSGCSPSNNTAWGASASSTIDSGSSAAAETDKRGNSPVISTQATIGGSSDIAASLSETSSAREEMLVESNIEDDGVEESKGDDEHELRRASDVLRSLARNGEDEQPEACSKRSSGIGPFPQLGTNNSEEMLEPKNLAHLYMGKSGKILVKSLSKRSLSVEQSSFTPARSVTFPEKEKPSVTFPEKEKPKLKDNDSSAVERASPTTTLSSLPVKLGWAEKINGESEYKQSLLHVSHRLSEAVEKALPLIEAEIHQRCIEKNIVRSCDAVIQAGNTVFIDVYSAVWNLVCFTEEDVIGDYAEAVSMLTRAITHGGQTEMRCHQRSSEPVALYSDAATIHAEFGKLMRKIEADTDTTVELPSGLKRLSRILEKVLLDFDPSDGCAKIGDCVRAMIKATSMRSVIRVMMFFLNNVDVVIVRIKDRFVTKPSLGGWRDLMINFYLKSDKNRHVCEVQVVHSRMLVARQGLPGHAIYGRVRNATELLEKLGMDPTNRSERVRELCELETPVEQLIHLGIDSYELLKAGYLPEDLLQHGLSDTEVREKEMALKKEQEASLTVSSSTLFNKKKYRGLLKAASSTRGSNPLLRFSQGKKDAKLDVKLKPKAKLKRAVGKIINIQRVGQSAPRNNLSKLPVIKLQGRGGKNDSDLTESREKAEDQGGSASGSGLFRPQEFLGKALAGLTSSRDLDR